MSKNKPDRDVAGSSGSKRNGVKCGKKQTTDIFIKILLVLLLLIWAVQNYWFYSKGNKPKPSYVIQRSPLADVYDQYRNLSLADPAIIAQMNEFEDMLNNLRHSDESTAFAPVITSDKGNIVIKIFVPGLKKMNIKTVAKGNTLQVSGCRKKAYKDNNAFRSVKHARTLSTFYDEFDFPVALDGKKITVEKRNDVLKLTVPCPEIKLVNNVCDKPECPPGAMPVDRHE